MINNDVPRQCDEMLYATKYNIFAYIGWWNFCVSMDIMILRGAKSMKKQKSNIARNLTMLRQLNKYSGRCS